MEIEHQGVYASINPGDSATWTTRWYLRRLPAGVEKKVGDPKLVDLVTGLLERASTPAVTAMGNPGATPARKRDCPDFRFRDSKSRPVDAKGRISPGIPQFPAR